MVTKIIDTVKARDVIDGDWRELVEYYGKSTDVKPAYAQNADRFYEMDTGNIYLFDEDDLVWLLQDFN